MALCQVSVTCFSCRNLIRCERSERRGESQVRRSWLRVSCGIWLHRYLARLNQGLILSIFIPFSFRCLRGDITRKHNLAPRFHPFSSIRLDWNFPAHFPGAVKWAVSHVSEPAPRSSALIHHTAFYMDQYEWDSTQTPAALHWDAGWLITSLQLFTLAPICIVGWRRAPGVHWHLQWPSSPCREHEIPPQKHRYEPGKGSFLFRLYSVTVIYRSPAAFPEQ